MPSSEVEQRAIPSSAEAGRAGAQLALVPTVAFGRAIAGVTVADRDGIAGCGAGTRCWCGRTALDVANPEGGVLLSGDPGRIGEPVVGEPGTDGRKWLPLPAFGTDGPEQSADRSPKRPPRSG